MLQVAADDSPVVGREGADGGHQQARGGDRVEAGDREQAVVDVQVDRALAVVDRCGPSAVPAEYYAGCDREGGGRLVRSGESGQLRLAAGELEDPVLRAELADPQRRRDRRVVLAEARVRPAPQPGLGEMREAAEKGDAGQYAVGAGKRPGVEVGPAIGGAQRGVEEVLLLDRGSRHGRAELLERATEILRRVHRGGG
ncbi:hypothetical protein F1D05_02925 [Kribbella qitaiheensis]|uniref:Uncharacterized protein n=1 Tax=Kribbella qitaiheensis TaxID=1544730 RepID=A0A7G6WST5_9ACTN|nr:hypothetical protein [Kribbella qitaiheensis]QNE17050.1 hypothetical protein F1D05_02925 [Kribbella qitaiheensis]